jgi:hypothetical protein
MRRLVSLASAFALVLVMAVPAVAHPRVPEQSVCVLPEAAKAGIHRAAANVADANGVAAHVLYVKSPHFCVD